MGSFSLHCGFVLVLVGVLWSRARDPSLGVVKIEGAEHGILLFACLIWSGR